MSEKNQGVLFVIIGLMFALLLCWAFMTDKDVNDLRHRVEALEGKP